VSPKAGILHDYDLMANAEPSAPRNTCKVCDIPDMAFQWSDYSGEAMCCQCGAPYQLKWGSEEQKKEGKYPYFSLREEFLPAAREFWKEKQIFVHYGASFSNHQGKDELVDWLKSHHPELLKEPK
jgi:hypothetical protein